MKRKSLAFLLAFWIMGALIFGVRPAAFALTGTCGMLSTNVATGNPDVSTGTLYNLMATLNFNNNTVTYNEATLTSPTSAILNSGTGVISFPGNSNAVTNATYSTSFTLTSNSSLSGSYSMTFTAQVPNQGPTSVTFLLLPVNSGNTILIQGQGVGFSGVCQF